MSKPDKLAEALQHAISHVHPALAEVLFAALAEMPTRLAQGQYATLKQLQDEILDTFQVSTIDWALVLDHAMELAKLAWEIYLMFKGISPPGPSPIGPNKE
jgi:hypothetical protein